MRPPNNLTIQHKTKLSMQVELTASAAAKIQELHDERAKPGELMRIFVDKGGCSGFEYGMTFDQAKTDDIQLEAHGVKFLVDPASMERIQGCKIHFDDGLNGKGFEFHNPNAETTCGCGRSFG